MQSDDLLAYGKPESGPGSPASAWLIQLLVALEHQFLLIVRNAWSLVLDSHFDLVPVFMFDADLNIASFRRKFDCIRQKIDQNLNEPFRIGHDLRVCSSKIQVDQ